MEIRFKVLERSAYLFYNRPLSTLDEQFQWWLQCIIIVGIVYMPHHTISVSRGYPVNNILSYNIPNTTIVENVSSDVHRVGCLLYTSDAADEEDSVDLGGRRVIKKKQITYNIALWTLKPA
eukprot:TRINITY_DN29506_c0_g1_i1.p1 TRINITY_DN29506_c0_g1~~TRINITY_DN29506_c0_g1_i1.p1  ORF type:complete len:121 (+),score=5.15 TRINITY_DN29506_c0_g1_i1:437-799(+)